MTDRPTFQNDKAGYIAVKGHEGRCVGRKNFLAHSICKTLTYIFCCNNWIRKYFSNQQSNVVCTGKGYVISHKKSVTIVSARIMLKSLPLLLIKSYLFSTLKDKKQQF